MWAAPTFGQGGGNAWRFPRLVHRGPRWRGSGGDRRSRLSTNSRHLLGVALRRPVPAQASTGRGTPLPGFASRAPDADAADYTSRRTRQGCASIRYRWPLGAGRGQRTICPKSYANGRRSSHSNCITKPTHWPIPTLSRHWKAQQLHCRKPGVCASPETARDYPSTG